MTHIAALDAFPYSQRSCLLLVQDCEGFSSVQDVSIKEARFIAETHAVPLTTHLRAIQGLKGIGDAWDALEKHRNHLSQKTQQNQNQNQ